MECTITTINVMLFFAASQAQSSADVPSDSHSFRK